MQLHFLLPSWALKSWISGNIFLLSITQRKGRKGWKAGDGLSDVWGNKWSDSKMSLNDGGKLSRGYLHCRGVSVSALWATETSRKPSTPQSQGAKSSPSEGRTTQSRSLHLLLQNQTPFCTSVMSDPTLSELQEAHNLILRQFSWHSYSERNSNKYKITPSNIQRKTFYF